MIITKVFDYKRAYMSFYVLSLMIKLCHLGNRKTLNGDSQKYAIQYFIKTLQ